MTQSLDRSIPKLIESGDEQQLLRALSMITLFSKFKGVTFGTSLVPIVNVMLNDDKHSSECLQAMSIILLDVPSMAKAFSIAEKDEDEEERSRRIVCNAIYVFFKKLPPQKIVPLLKAVTTKLMPFASDRDEDVRLFVVNTFIEMYKKLPVIFAKQLKKMPPALQRTVMIAASKQK